MHAELSHQKNCKKKSIVTDIQTGEIACSTCGSVLSQQVIDEGSEINEIGNLSRSKSRVGQKISLKMIDMGLSTIIESKDKDASGKNLSGENRRMFYRLRMWDRNSRSAGSVKSFQKAFTLLDGIAKKLGLPESTIEYAAYIFRKIESKKLLAGRSTTDMIYATVYVTCRLTNTPRTIQDIAVAGNVKKKNIQRAYRFIVKELEIYPNTYNPIEFVTRIAKAANMSEKTERLAFKILDIAEKNNVSTSKNPMSMAAASINLASKINKEKTSQVQISKISGISTVTIRDRVKEIQKKMTGGEIYG